VKQSFPGTKLRVVAAGECMLELSRQGGLWRMGAAGDSFNTALYLRRLGAQVRYLTALGEDPFSEEMLRSWRHEGLDTSLVLRDPARLPGLYAIRTDEAGERSFHYWRQQAAARQLFRLPGSDGALRAAAHCDLLYLTGITLSLFDATDRKRWVELAAEVRRQGAVVAFDPNYRPQGWSSATEARHAAELIAPHTSIVLTTDTDENQLYGNSCSADILARWLDAGVGEVVVKRGASGALACSGSETVEVAVPAAVAVADSTAAGDSFNAAYLATRLRGSTLAQAAHAGNVLAGAVVQVTGAILPAEQMPALFVDYAEPM
jgi:2-dehydro-3-deoxygluconokinase